MSVIYNEIGLYPAAWLGNLITRGHLPTGIVETRSIRDLVASDVADHTHAHFFAGIGGWGLALRLAGWPDDVPVWTGSCPCQPFSQAGLRKGADNEQHLWPDWFRLIEQCRPSVVFGEQVASDDGLRWFDAVSVDLEGSGYAVGAADLCAAGVGAPHGRQRLYFVARRLADAESDRAARVISRGVGETGKAEEAHGCRGPAVERDARPFGASHQPWLRPDWVRCGDGKTRPIEPGSFPLAHGLPTDVERLRAYGNAIVPQVAAMFIRAVMGWLLPVVGAIMDWATTG